MTEPEFERHVGFTGTRAGMTPVQIERVAALLRSMKGHGWLHHGDCVGSDAEAHDLAVKCGLKTAIHPPLVAQARAFRAGDVIHPPLDYLVRNRMIVNATRGLLATPGGMREEQRSGTWSAIRYARMMRKPRVIVYPDGKVVNER